MPEPGRFWHIAPCLQAPSPKISTRHIGANYVDSLAMYYYLVFYPLLADGLAIDTKSVPFQSNWLDLVSIIGVYIATISLTLVCVCVYSNQKYIIT